MGSAVVHKNVVWRCVSPHYTAVGSQSHSPAVCVQLDCAGFAERFHHPLQQNLRGLAYAAVAAHILVSARRGASGQHGPVTDKLPCLSPVRLAISIPPPRCNHWRAPKQQSKPLANVTILICCPSSTCWHHISSLQDQLHQWHKVTHTRKAQMH